MNNRKESTWTSPFTDMDIYLFKEGNHFRLYEKLGAHICNGGVRFAIWAPNAKSVSVIGEFNNWDKKAHPLSPRQDETGIWEGFIEGIDSGTLYKYHIVSNYNNYEVDKGDPYAFYWERPPKTASIVWDLNYEWKDEKWMKERAKRNSFKSPMSIYEVHLGSWRRFPEEGNRFLTYRELASFLPNYAKEMGFTHVEFLPVMEHPFYGSWGYQTLGYFAPTARYGSPQDFMYLIDVLHQNEIGVILDWVPSHFPNDGHGLVFFDGTHLYEHADPRKGFHPDWKSCIFNYGRNEVRNFLISSALFWLDKYHVDGLRVDAVASLLYLDYSRKDGEWIPNEYGGRENLEAIHFLKRFNEEVYKNYPDVQTIAEESTAWPQATRPTHLGGLGFGMKWNMGWMHDTLEYFSKDPIFRKYHHNQLTFSIWYAFFENFVLPLSHDEVVHGKGSLIAKMPGDDWQKFANLRALLGYQWLHPGKKLLFMGGELGQWREWNHESSIDWHLLEYPNHEGVRHFVRDLNHLLSSEPALYERDFENTGFEWVDFSDWESSVISFLRKSEDQTVLVVCNFTPIPRYNYRIGVPSGGFWKEILNSDAKEYGGSGHGNFGGLEATPVPIHGRFHSLVMTLPPLSVTVFKKA
ncbi:1,4-alpha-glucan branching protein GlgB [Acetomicrobium hydrogeniformans]|jgi:1,4-alpha-glucan branching enzyme|uniref:1,4-alpha-glucan branching enzyme GlgB n=1 Tax=Acetomicrobium hydrogeniformans ATCC BAA-1850 TaxID=592015 RepID=A0A0T5X8F3_9BACT|nr:1,4-alpha-glucan branching protein GlgB [Acetomicrobium hydrogeniformans]KRT34733.1 1,4-alpha-glucan branching enzyme [Acetomicrobium hydrogeniformans ATCC BAA-1850]